MSDGHTLHPTVLRQYDIRGIVGRTLSEADMRAIGRAFGTMLVGVGGASVAVGYDGRLSSPDMEAALVDGLAACGLKVYRVGRGPSPMLYFANKHLGCDGAMMVTGSHNPPDHNGIKMIFKGQPFFAGDIQELGRIAAEGAFATGGGQVIDRPVLADYVARVASDARHGRPLKVAWDPGNGAAGEAAALLCARLSGSHVMINEAIDGTFPAHHPDPTVEENLEQLKDLVRRQGCDLGFAFDGDGDRIGVVDERGRVLWGDQILILLAAEILARRPGETIITEVKASQAFFEEIERMGGKPLMWATGHSVIKKKMVETGAPLAGEMSGHIFFADGYYGYDDALYAAVRLLNVLAESEDGLGALRDSLPSMVNTPEIRIECAEERKFAVIEEVKQRLRGRADVAVIDVDGVRVQTDEGWWLLRASNTQAVLVARCEAADDAGLRKLKSILIDQLAASAIAAPADLA